MAWPVQAKRDHTYQRMQFTQIQVVQTAERRRSATVALPVPLILSNSILDGLQSASPLFSYVKPQPHRLKKHSGVRDRPFWA